MAYSRFTATELEENFNLQQGFVKDLFAAVKNKEASEFIKTSLAKTIEFALELNTEKARSEYIIAPVLFELKSQTNDKISVFSGIEFNVDRKLGFTGWCDFLVSRSPFQRGLKAPVVVAVGAKNQDFDAGITQCIAEMYAATLFNAKRNQDFKVIYGCVTTGDAWRFLLLKDKQALIDTTIFDVRKDLDKILGILCAMSLGELDDQIN